MNIQPAPVMRLDADMQNRTRSAGKSIKLECEITGSPRPRYTWYKDEERIWADGVGASGQMAQRIEYNEIAYGHSIRIKPLQEIDTGWYRCEAWNNAELMNTLTTSGYLTVPPPGADNDSKKPGNNRGGGGGSRADDPVELRIDGPLFGDGGTCINYGDRGACLSVLGAGTRVYLARDQTLDSINKYISMFLQQENISSTCRPYARDILCRQFLQICDINEMPQAPCQAGCRELESGVCKSDFDKARNVATVMGTKIVPDCALLPTEQTNPFCPRLAVPDKGDSASNGQSTENCYEGDGTSYQGTKNTGKSGRTCLRWDDSRIRMGHVGFHSQCRAPISDSYTTNSKEPWCYVTPNQQETCGVEECTTAAPPLMTTVLYVMVPLAAALLLLLLALSVFCCCRKKKRNRKGHRPLPQFIDVLPAATKHSLQIATYPLSGVTFLDEIQDGLFGKVFSGELSGAYHPTGASQQISIKMFKEPLSPQLQKSFKTEVELLADLKHPNVIHLLGVTMSQYPWCILLEHLHTSLYTLLRSRSCDASSDSDSVSSIEHADMIYIAVQVAAGMEYLSSRGCVHTDLRSHTVWVGSHLSAKVTCASLQHQNLALANRTQIFQSPHLLPIRWMSPESLLQHVFTTESDVWAFAVTLWEIFAMADLPYRGYSDQQCIELIRCRHLLPPPPECPDFIYQLMTDCWHEAPARRPSFHQVHCSLLQWKSEGLLRLPSGPASTVNSHQSYPPPSYQIDQEASELLITRPSQPNSTTHTADVRLLKGYVPPLMPFSPPLSQHSHNHRSPGVQRQPPSAPFYAESQSSSTGSSRRKSHHKSQQQQQTAVQYKAQLTAFQQVPWRLPLAQQTTAI